MPCLKTLSMTAAGDQFTPLHTAIYVASTDKILGTMENYVVEFNASTGSYIRAVKFLSPMYGPMHLGLVGTAPYVAAYNDRSAQNTSPANIIHIRSDIFPVNTTTLAAGSGLGIYANVVPDAFLYAVAGPHQFLTVGTRVYFLRPTIDRVWVCYIDTLNPLINFYRAGSAGFWAEQFCTDGTFIYVADPSTPQIRYFDLNLTFVDTSPTQAGATYYWPVSVEWVPAPTSKVHAVCGDKWMVRVDSFATNSNTYIDLEAALATAGYAITGIMPIRLRYRSSDQKLYIPVQNKDGIIVYDPATATVSDWKSGFESPVDIVFTTTKAFAVQSSIVGIKEIV